VKKPRIGFLDFECAPIIAHVWGLFDQNVGLNQIKKDWHLMSAAFSYDGENKIHYMDQRHARDMENDKKLCIWVVELINSCDILIGQNIKKYDLRKLFARCIKWGLTPPKPVQVIDTLQIARKYFAFTSNKQAYITDYLGVPKKYEHKEFPGFDLWSECLKGNPKAWRALKKYNCDDLIGLKGMWKKLQPWAGKSFSVYHDGEHRCRCGSGNLERRGFHHTDTAKYQQYWCRDCGAWTRGGTNILGKGVSSQIGR
jgi:hypothetical protein